MVSRTNQFWLVAFFLSKYGFVVEDKTLPPTELGATKWKEAYRMFYESLGNGRTIDAFELSLRNARDTFDSHIVESKRVGWLDNTGKPGYLISSAELVLTQYSQISRVKIWNEIKDLANLELPSYKKREIDDLAVMQNMETATGDRLSLTEGGAKIVISLRYERNIKLRNLAFKIHGYSCVVCGFDYSKFYGKWGEGFAEVHHLVPVSELGLSKRKIDVKNDLIVLCANCHRMIHRKKGITLTIDELKAKITLPVENL